MKSKKILKIVSLVLCGSLALGTAYFVGAENGADDTKTTADAKTEQTDKSDSAAVTKDECVYVIAGADGATKKVIVSDWIKNSLYASSVNDSSSLSDIINVKGDESYSMNGDNMKVWDAQGNDIYYRGNIEKELPVNISISYKLDGAAMSAEDMKGKSGKATIRFDYKNNQYENVEIDGKTEKIYVPFAVLTGTMFDNDKFRNIEIENGRTINDGDRTIAAGLVLPGLKTNLGSFADDLEIPEYIEITADVTDFEMNTTMTLATNELFNEVETDKLDDLDKVTDAIDEVNSALDKLSDGADKLYDGLNTLLSKSDTLIAGIDSLAQGAKQVNDGTSKLYGGSTQLDSGLSELLSGLTTLDSNSAKLNGGAKQVFETLLKTADSQIAAAGLKADSLTIDNYATVLSKLISGLDKDTVYKMAYNTALDTVTKQVKANETQIRAGVKKATRDKIVVAVLKQAGYDMTADQYDAAVKAGQISEAVQKAVNDNVEKKLADPATVAAMDKAYEEQVQKLIDENMKSDEVTSQINAAVAKAAAGQSSLSTLKAQLDSYNEFYTGLKEYTDGVASAKAGAAKLKAGSSDLKDGAKQLSDGTAALKDGTDKLNSGSAALKDGVSQLTDGAKQLSDGMTEFRTKVKDKLSALDTNGLNTLSTRVKATIDVSKNYKNFSGIADGMDGSVRFIYKTESVKK